MPHSASVVVSRPLSEVEAHLWSVTNWASCLSDVVSVRRASHERYAVELRSGRRVEEVLVAVRWNARHHRFSWKALEGPTWAGELKLRAVNGRRTQLELGVIAVPRTFLGSLAEMVGGGRRDVAGDALRLHHLIDQIPAPARASRPAGVTHTTRLTGLSNLSDEQSLAELDASLLATALVEESFERVQRMPGSPRPSADLVPAIVVR